MSNLRGRVAVVTGASKGIGAAIATHLAAAGAAVVVNYASSKESAEQVVAAIARKGGRAIGVQADVSKPADVDRLFAEAMRQLGRLDILVNNAGVYDFLPLEEVTEAHFHRLFDLNVLGLLLASKAAARHFDGRGGSIINVSSIASRTAPANASVYSATKAAVDAITRSLATELGPRNIRVNAINPGVIETEGTRAAKFGETELAKQLEAQTPLGRIGQPRDVAPAAVFLASPDAAWITGETMLVSGGLR